MRLKESIDTILDILAIFTFIRKMFELLGRRRHLEPADARADDMESSEPPHQGS